MESEPALLPQSAHVQAHQSMSPQPVDERSSCGERCEKLTESSAEDKGMRDPR
jgi:hypothetical protein